MYAYHVMWLLGFLMINNEIHIHYVRVVCFGSVLIL
jgi:hypothetical protein